MITNDSCSPCQMRMDHWRNNHGPETNQSINSSSNAATTDDFSRRRKTSMVPPTSDCDACVPGGKKPAFSTLVFSSLPFLLTFLLVSTLVLQKLVPLLSAGGPTSLHGREKSTVLGDGHARWFSFSHLGGLRPSSRPPIKRVSAFAFSTTIALAAVLAELILCEISNTMNPAARGLAFHITVSLLLFLLVVAIPFLEIHSVISAAGYEFTGPGQGRLRLAWVFQLAGFTAWLLGFWWSGERLLGTRATHSHTATATATGHPTRLTEACLERVGVIGISVMSLLSGFASVSSPWHNLFSRPRPVTETDLARKQAGLEATTDMLGSKRSRLQALERKMSDGPRESFFHQALGSIRGNAELTERRTLELEIAGLETMSVALSASVALRQSRLRDQARARTPTGRLILAGSFVFSLFCLYRILSTSLTAIHRLLARPSSSQGRGAGRPFTPSDPVNHILALLAKHYDPQLDQATRARQISFFLSGLILAASVSSVMQTFRLLARFAPGLLRAVQANLGLVVAQVCATYVISAALMLGGIMPGQVVGEGLRALGGREMGWLDAWFERWFLAGVLLTAGGIWLGRKFAGGIYGAYDDDDYDEEGESGSGVLEEGGGRKRRS